MTDVYYVHRSGALTLSRVSVFFVASDYLRQNEMSDNLVMRKSREGLGIFQPILNQRRIIDWMHQVGVNWKKEHHWVIMNHGEQIEFYWMSYGPKSPDLVVDVFKRIEERLKSILPPDFTYRVSSGEFIFSNSMTASREITKLLEDHGLEP